MKKIVLGLLIMTSVMFVYNAYDVYGEVQYQKIKGRLDSETIDFSNRVLSEEERSQIFDLAQKHRVNIIVSKDDGHNNKSIDGYYIQMNNNDLWDVVQLKSKGIGLDDSGSLEMYEAFNQLDYAISTMNNDHPLTIHMPLMKQGIELIPMTLREGDLPSRFHISSWQYEHVVEFNGAMEEVFGQDVAKYIDDRQTIDMISISIKSLFRNAISLGLVVVSFVLLALVRYSNARFDPILMRKGYSHFDIFVRQLGRLIKRIVVVGVIGLCVGVLLKRTFDIQMFLIVKSHLILLLFYTLLITGMYGLLQLLMAKEIIN